MCNVCMYENLRLSSAALSSRPVCQLSFILSFRRREMVEHPFGTIKARMGATHFLMKTLPRVAAEMALHVLAYNMTRVMNIMGTKPLLATLRA
jgi:hypothetical protein